MENSNQEIIEIKVKAQFIGEFTNWKSWIANVNSCSQKYGLTQQLLHIDSNGYNTTGYNLRNTNRDKIYPVKTYLLVQDPEVKRHEPFKSNSTN